jgi:hypothetical protein
MTLEAGDVHARVLGPGRRRPPHVMKGMVKPLTVTVQAPTH